MLKTDGAIIVGATPIAFQWAGGLNAPTQAAGDNSAKIANTSFVQAAIAALIASSPAALDTLNELAAALGNDANFASTVTNVLALKAPIASPALTGNPTAPTPAQFDDDTSVATTAFVKKNAGQMAGFRDISVNTTLAASDAGKFIVSNVGTGFVNVALPAVSSVPIGSMFVIAHASSTMSGFAVGVSGADLLNLNGLSDNVVPYPMAAGESIVVISTGSAWKIVSGNGASFLKGGGGFGSSLAASGYQKLPSGLIVQWGSLTATSTTTSTTSNATLPVAFPNAGLSAVATRSTDVNNSATPITADAVVSISTTQIGIAHARSSGSIANTWRFFAIGY